MNYNVYAIKLVKNVFSKSKLLRLCVLKTLDQGKKIRPYDIPLKPPDLATAHPKINPVTSRNRTENTKPTFFRDKLIKQVETKLRLS